MRYPVAAAAVLCLLGAPVLAQQQVPALDLTVTATPLLGSDYLFRGISQTRNRPAAQLTLDVQHDSGIYAGAFLSNATFLAAPYNDTRQELDLTAGYRTSFGALSLDAGVVGYLYPGQSKPDGTQLNEYYEVVLKAAYDIQPVKFSAAVAYSPNFFGHSGDGFYLEGGADVTLPLGFTAFGRLGYQWIERNARFGTPDYLWYGLGLQREVVVGIVVALGWYGTNIGKSECAPVTARADEGQKICDGRVMVSLSRAF